MCEKKGENWFSRSTAVPSEKQKRKTDVCRRAIFIVVIIIKAWYTILYK